MEITGNPDMATGCFAGGTVSCYARSRMADKFYVPGSQRAAKVRDLFAAIATQYDLINDLQSFGLHRYWKRRLVDLAEIRPGQKALDLCCGTGDVAFALHRAGAQTLGCDFSAPMLQVAEQRR